MAKSKPIPEEVSEPADLDREGSFEDIFLTHWEPICRILTRITGDISQAEDLALETFWRYWQHPPAGINNLKAWLYRVAVNLGYNAIRSGKRRTFHETNAGKDFLKNDSPANPEVTVEQSIERDLVRYTLSRMKPREAKILILRHSGQSYRQIAETLDIRTSSVGALLLRAEKRFRKIYEETRTENESPKR